MPKSFIVAPLPAERIGQAFPVVQALDPTMTPTRWHALAAPFALSDGSRGIIACRMGTGHIRGLFCWALDGDGALRVGPFAVAGLFDARATAEGLIAAIDQLAWRFGVERVTLELKGCAVTTVPHCDLPALFTGLGYRREGDTLTRDTAGAEPTVSAATA